ncbi:TetR/AcrR family transcriptional regulator [Nocardia sp. N2S4-5]|uniref:TetR/AcrR family transcriptional regulator n=1 Tax=Nocardia sp. N2S4-5 TaxID=3351565 RepID=UPI0037D16847
MAPHVVDDSGGLIATPGDPHDEDPRRLRSRARLLDAATDLLKTGGAEAVTVEAVTRVSKVARATLYRHFGSVRRLRAAALERLLPPRAEPLAEGSFRDRLIDLVYRQAAFIDTAPLYAAMLAWFANGDAADSEAGALRGRLVELYRRPLDQLLAGADDGAARRDLDSSVAPAQLFGPILFTRLIGPGRTTRADCVRIVDDFLAARAAASPRYDGPSP